MSNAPFKIAFWMMSLAFGLTVLLAGLKPEEIRIALNPELRPKPADLQELEPLDAAEHVKATPGATLSQVAKTQQPPGVKPAVDIQLVQESVPPAQQNLPENVLPTPITAPHPTQNFVRFQQISPPPIRVASADLNASLGVSDWRSDEEVALVPIPDKRFALSGTEPGNQETSVPRKILVPDPVDIPATHRLSLNDELSELKGNIIRLRLAQARREFDEIRRSEVQDEIETVEAELSNLREQIRNLKESKTIAGKEVEIVASPPTPVHKEAHEETSAQITEVEPASTLETASFESVIEVTAGQTEETFHFRFVNAPVSEVLETLGKHGGRKVVVGPGIAGTFTGEFAETAANQAFAAVIKANQFGLSFRGNYVLVRAERDPKIR